MRLAYRGGPGGDLRGGWVGFLDRWPWDLFGSFTFRDDPHPEAADKRFRVFISTLNRQLYGRRWYKRGEGVTFCVAMERQERGVVHFHALLKSAELVELLRSSWLQVEGHCQNDVMELWNQLAGFARIEPIESSELVRNYVSKYCTKGGGEIELGGPGMPQESKTAYPPRVDRPWLTTAVGRASAMTILHQVTTAEELHELLCWATGEPGFNRRTEELRRDVRVRALACRAGVAAS